MKKILALFLISFLYILNVQATTHTILVGQGGLTFSPNTLNVMVGDIVHFEWVSGTHTTTSLTIPANAATWNTSLTSTSTSFDYTVTEAGTYNYQCNPHSGSGMNGSFTASTATSIKNKYSEITNSSKLSPNPAVEQSTLSFNSSTAFKATVRIYDATGVLMSEEKIKIEQGDNTHSINTTPLRSGMYYVNVLDKDEAFLVLRLIKQ